MISTNIPTLEEVERLLDSPWRTIKDLFEKVPYKTLMLATHPDRNPGEKKAELLFKQIQDLEAIQDKPLPAVKGKKNNYRLLRTLAVGDIADVYLGESDDGDYIVKVSPYVS